MSLQLKSWKFATFEYPTATASSMLEEPGAAACRALFLANQRIPVSAVPNGRHHGIGASTITSPGLPPDLQTVTPSGLELYQFAMASLRTHQAARLLRTVSSRAPQLTTRRYESSSIVKAQQPAHEQPIEPAQQAPNQPDYGAHFDKATSYMRPRSPPPSSQPGNAS